MTAPDPAISPPASAPSTARSSTKVCSIAPSTELISSPVTKPDRVDDVGVEVAVRSRPCNIALEPPEERSRRAAPALQVDGASVIDPTEGARCHQLVGERHGGDSPVVVPDERLTFGGCRRRGHRLGVGQRSGERLLAGDVLAGLECGDRLFGVDVVRRADVDEVDGVVGDAAAPVDGGVEPSPTLGERRRVRPRSGRSRCASPVADRSRRTARR